METISSSETSVDFQQATRRYIPEDSTLYNHRCENLKSYRVCRNLHYSMGSAVGIPKDNKQFCEESIALNAVICM
jgi:hypothetical protein